MQHNEQLQENYWVLDEQVQKMQQQMNELEKRDNEVYRAIFEANPIPDSARAKEMEQQKGNGNGDEYDQLRAGKFYSQSINNLAQPHGVPGKIL